MKNLLNSILKQLENYDVEFTYNTPLLEITIDSEYHREVMIIFIGILEYMRDKNSTLSDFVKIKPSDYATFLCFNSKTKYYEFIRILEKYNIAMVSLEELDKLIGLN